MTQQPYAPSPNTAWRTPGSPGPRAAGPNGAGPIAQVLIVTCGPRTTLLTPGIPVRIGRDPNSQLLVDDSRISRTHLVLTLLGGDQVQLEDHSSNGTFLQGSQGIQGSPGMTGPQGMAGGRLAGSVVLAAPFTVMMGAPDGYPLQVRAASGLSPIESSPFATILAPQRPTAPAAPTTRSPASGPPMTGSPASGLSAPRSPASGPVSPASPASTGSWLIGRDPAAAICIDDPLVSRAHAELRPAGDGFDVVDLHSSNGTWINSRRIDRDHLGQGDRLTVGRTTLVCHDRQLSPMAPPRTVLAAHDVTFTLPDGKKLLDDVSFGLPSATLVAVIGPSGAGKSTLLKALTGSQPATSGSVVYEGEDLYSNYDGLRGRIGVVPQDDLVHARLTVRQALGYAAKLRLPKDYTDPQRDHEVDRVMNDLGLVEHERTTISRLSGGQRKRVSVALELLTQPSLLFLDEPTSGLDPNLDRSVMRLLRSQADTGRVVFVITHSVANLSLCDTVMLLAPGGKIAYFGPPGQLMGHFQMEDYADVFEAVTAQPDLWKERFAHSRLAGDAAPPQPQAPRGGGRARVRVSSAARQWRTLVSRQFRILASDRNLMLSTIFMPVLIALMALAIPGGAGFGPQDRQHPGEASTLLTIMVIGAAFMGVSSSIRELVAERPIFLRERAVGLSQQMYLMSKVTVLLFLCALQTALVIGVVMIGKDGPGPGVLMPGWPELAIAIFGTAFSSAMLGLLISAVVTTNEQVMPAMVVSVMAQLVLCGGIIQVTDRTVMEILAAPMPGRWGYAQAASTVNLQGIRIPAPGTVDDWLWKHEAGSWLTSGGALLAICLLAWIATAMVLRRQKANA